MRKKQFVDVHIIQTLPPSNVNRDDTGSPKSAVFGGIRRARVSSQSWKRATRLGFAEMLDVSELGVRTKRAAELVGEEIARIRPDLAGAAADLGAGVLKAGGLKLSGPKQDGRSGEDTGYLLFISNWQVRRLAELAIRGKEGVPASKENVKEVLASGRSVDLALFGRMVADAPDLSVDAAARVAHALSVHAVDAEYDYFTAVDEVKSRAGNDEDAGAGMIGTVEFNSSTLYRYAAVDVRELQESLGDREAVVRAVEAFVSSFARSMPSGKLNTFANSTLPDVVFVRTRSDQPVSLVGAFEIPPARGVDGGWVVSSSLAMAEYCRGIDEVYGDGGGESWVACRTDLAAGFAALAQRRPFNELVGSVGRAVRGADLD